MPDLADAGLPGLALVQQPLQPGLQLQHGLSAALQHCTSSCGGQTRTDLVLGSALTRCIQSCPPLLNWRGGRMVSSRAGRGVRLAATPPCRPGQSASTAASYCTREKEELIFQPITSIIRKLQCML